MNDTFRNARHAALLSLRQALNLPWSLLLTPGEYLGTLECTEYECKTRFCQDPIWILKETEKAARDWWN